MSKIRDIVRSILDEELNVLLKDAAWRIQQANTGRQIPAEGLNLSTHQLTGYTVTDNSPLAGQIAWADVYIVFQGTTYGPYAGDAAVKYVYWDAASTAALIETDTKPVLDNDDALVFINNGGTAKVVIGGNGQHDGSQLLDGSVNSGEIANSAVSGAKILDGAVTDAKVTDVSGSKLTANSVGDGKISDVSGSKLTAGSVTDGKISDVSGSKLTASSVTNGKLADGTVQTDKLNLLHHLIF